jgi:hypothetical protein
VTASACESTEQESAKIARQEQAAGASALKLGAVNPRVRVSEVTLVKGGGRMAVAARLTSSSTRVQTNVPVLVSVSGTAGKILYTNATPGLEASLQHVSSLRAHQAVWFVDDQVLTNQQTSKVTVQAGTGASTPSSPAMSFTSTALHTAQQAGVSVLSGKLVAHGASPRVGATLFAVALKNGRVRAAGRATVTSVSRSRAATPFQIFLVGDAAGATVELSAVPVTGKPIGG